MKIFRFSAAAAMVVMCGSAAAASFSETNKSGADIWVQPSKAGYTIEYTGDGKAVAVQFDLHDPAVKTGNYSCGERLASTHIASCTLHESEGFLRVIVYTVSQDILPDSTLVSVATSGSSSTEKSLTASKGAVSRSGATLKNVIVADAEAKDLTPDHLK